MLFSLSTFSVVLASLSMVSASQVHGHSKKPRHNAVVHGHQKRTSGRATWYDVGLGACGNYNSPGDYIVALNSHQLDTSTYPPVQCGNKIRISYGGKTAIATVEDECPGCPYGALDMSKGLFTHFADLGVGEFTMQWEYISGSDNGGDNGGDQTTTTKKKTTTTTHHTTTTTTTTTKKTTTTTTTTKTSSSTSDSDSSTSTTASSTTSADDSSATPSGDDSTGDNGGDSYIANQQQFIAVLGNMASVGRSS